MNIFYAVLDWEFLRCDGAAKVPNIFKKTFYLGLGSKTQINHPPEINAGDTIHVIGNIYLFIYLFIYLLTLF